MSKELIDDLLKLATDIQNMNTLLNAYLRDRPSTRDWTMASLAPVYPSVHTTYHDIMTKYASELAKLLDYIEGEICVYAFMDKMDELNVGVYNAMLLPVVHIHNLGIHLDNARYYTSVLADYLTEFTGEQDG